MPTGHFRLKVNPDYPKINGADQQGRSDSVPSFYKKILRWREKNPAVHAGTYRDLLPVHPQVWVYERRSDKDVLAIIANFSDQIVPKPGGLPDTVTLSNYIGESAARRPSEAQTMAG